MGLIEYAIKEYTNSYNSIETGGVTVYEIPAEEYKVLVCSDGTTLDFVIGNIANVSGAGTGKAELYFNNLNIESLHGNYEIDFENGKVSLNYTMLLKNAVLSGKIMKECIDGMLCYIKATGIAEMNFEKKEER